MSVGIRWRDRRAGFAKVVVLFVTLPRDCTSMASRDWVTQAVSPFRGSEILLTRHVYHSKCLTGAWITRLFI